MNQVLSQREVDALLDAVGDGNLPADGGGNGNSKSIIP